METLFSNFPVIEYNGSQVVDITKCITMVPTAFKNPFSFIPYTITEGKRSDHVANEVYGDPYMEWAIFLANKQIDPYVWYMDTNQFYDFVNQKYGDWILAQQKVKYYRNNWYNGTNLTPSGYEALEPVLSKYFQPIFDGSNNIIEYTRTIADWRVNTNHLLMMNFTISIPKFTLDELVNIQYDANVVGNGQVSYTTNGSLYIKHVGGNYLPNNNVINVSAFSVIGQESNSQIAISHANQLSISVIDTLDPLEDIYYDPVTYFDYENDLNEGNKNIIVLANGYSRQLANEIQSILS